LALRVSTLFDVVRNAAITAITKAVAKIANTVRWVIGLLRLPIVQIDWLRFLPRGGNFSRSQNRLSRALMLRYRVSPPIGVRTPS
jgi:hypothetical protein